MSNSLQEERELKAKTIMELQDVWGDGYAWGHRDADISGGAPVIHSTGKLLELFKQYAAKERLHGRLEVYREVTSSWGRRSYINELYKNALMEFKGPSDDTGVQES